MLTDQTTRLIEVVSAVIFRDALDHLINCELKKHFILVVQICAFLVDADAITKGRQDKRAKCGGAKQIFQRDVFYVRQQLVGKWVEIHEIEVGHRCDDF